MRTLIIEDDAETAAFIAAGLRSRGHEPMLAADGREGFEIAAHETFDVIILDRMLPGLDGLSVVALLRAEGVSTPVLFLTNLSGVDDRVEGLGAGGDDYLVKPFAFEELLARLYALARRPTLGGSPTRLAAGDLEVDLIARTVKPRGESIELQPREFRLLEVCCAATAGLSRAGCFSNRFGSLISIRARISLRRYISRLRTKIDRGRAPMI